MLTLVFSPRFCLSSKVDYSQATLAFATCPITVTQFQSIYSSDQPDIDSLTRIAFENVSVRVSPKSTRRSVYEHYQPFGESISLFIPL